MLGKLFNLTSGAVGGASVQQTSPGIRLPPESVQEDIHTRSLLFPDTQELFHREDQVFPLPASTFFQSGSHTSAYDYDKEVDFDVRDVRIIIMQDALGNVNPSLLCQLVSIYPSRFAASSYITEKEQPGPNHRKKILVTRLFPVNLPSDDPETPQGVAEDSTGFPFPYSPDESKPKRKKPKPVPKRTPMYAVALVIPLPANSTNSTNSGTAASKPPFRASSSFNEPDAFPSSLGSTRRAGWSMVGSGYGLDSFESYYSNDAEDRMDFITQHWDIIMRTLTHLQSVVASSLYPMLKQADSSAPDPYPMNAPIQVGRTASMHNRRGSDASQVKLPKQYAKLVTLPPNALMQDQQTRS
ncbi:hypothetical protein ONZ43_g917 [Nemania bipapillata]|uniref:Uncharacterized protein n=1 Tax=Nemania bipapillata TaxID=110536 RepID=A0ACC2J693_9PEZI|nr:hypothetical protein ONZ43_g917 [Nemania bipapillata]